MVSQLQLLGRVGINGFSAWASDNLPILSLLFSTQLSSVRLLYISPPRVSLCYKACTDSIYQIQTIPGLYYTFRAENIQVLHRAARGFAVRWRQTPASS